MELLRIAAVCVLLMIMVSYAGAQPKDTLFLKNGEVLIGEIKSIALGRVNIDADDIDVVGIKAYKIKTIVAVSHLYRLESTSREVLYTIIRADTAMGKVLVQNGQQWLSMNIEDIANLTYFKGKNQALWEGTASAGYSYTRSSDIGRLNTDLTFKRITSKTEIVAQGSVILTQTDTGWTRDNENAGLSGYYYFNSFWQAIALLNYQRNLELGLARRFQEGIGVGANLVSSQHVRLKTSTGAVFNQEKNLEGTSTSTQVEWSLINSFNFFRFRKPELNLSTTQNFYLSLTQKGRVRHDGNVKMTWKLIGDLSINVTLYDNFDNQPPGVDAATLDFGIVFGLSYSF